MNISDTILTIEANAKRVGLTINDLCEEAGVAASNFSRWKRKKTTPNFSTVSKLEKVIARHAPPPGPNGEHRSSKGS